MSKILDKYAMKEVVMDLVTYCEADALAMYDLYLATTWVRVLAAIEDDLAVLKLLCFDDTQKREL